MYMATAGRARNLTTPMMSMLDDLLLMLTNSVSKTRVASAEKERKNDTNLIALNY